LSHANVQRSARLSAFGDFDQEGVGIGVEARPIRGENLVPAFDLQPPALFIDNSDLPINLGVSQPLLLQDGPIGFSTLSPR